MIRALLLALFLTPVLLKSAAGAEEKEMTIEDFLQSLSDVPGIVYRRDPFQESAPPFEIPKVLDTGEEVINPTAPVMERYPVKRYEVVAVLLGDKYPRALVRLPESEKKKVVIVKESDKIGVRKGVISKITPEGLIIEQNTKTQHGFVEKMEIMLRVGVAADSKGSNNVAETTNFSNTGEMPGGVANMPGAPGGAMGTPSPGGFMPVK